MIVRLFQGYFQLMAFQPFGGQKFVEITNGARITSAIAGWWSYFDVLYCNEN
jgi:hypothetical protein